MVPLLPYGRLLSARVSHSVRRSTSVTHSIARSACVTTRVARRAFTSTGTADKTDTDDADVAQGPKDTLLMLGYSVKENEMEQHVQALKDALRLKLMTLKYYSEDMAQSFTGKMNRHVYHHCLDLAMAQHQSVQFINEAKENYLKALEIWTQLRGSESREVSNMLCLIGVVLRDIGDIDGAMSAFKDSLRIE
ncbi:hsp70 interacting protein, putative [Babesia ovis]|uniref:Hsp70 interacting protein, putative n=1 Tax=Babesia ovis TaxID=5869 RepID=A0A9W5TE05_BABOV|nr:hsp70 interacting protein, putative [Babesia ovis]